MLRMFFFFFFNDTAATEIYTYCLTLSLHDALPIFPPGTTPFLIDASQAFGTGGHDTTAGCLAMLDRLARQGASPRNIADIGTGTGLLAFAAMALWPREKVIARSEEHPSELQSLMRISSAVF